MKKWYKQVAVTVVLALTVTSMFACSRNENDSGGNAAPGAKKNTTLTWSFGKDSTGTNVDLAKKFEEKNPGIKINILEQPAKSDQQHNDYVTKLSSGDTSIDVMNIDVIWPPEFAASKWLEPLNSHFTKEELDKFLPGPLGGATYNGQLYAMPYYTDAGMLFYRKDILDEAGVKPPKTWDELTELSKKLKGKGGTEYGMTYQANQYEGLVCNLLEYMWGNGGDVLDKDGKAVINSQNNIDALKFFSKLTQSDLVPKGVTTYVEEDARIPFTEGKAVFMRNWPYAWAKSQEDASKVKGKVGVVPMPVGPSGKNPAATLGGWDLAINGNISKENKEASVKFVKYLVSPEAMAYKAVKGGRIPTLKVAFKDAEVLKANPHFESLYDVFINAKPRPVSPIYPQISDVIQIETHKAITGAQTSEASIANMQTKVSGFLNSANK